MQNSAIRSTKAYHAFKEHIKNFIEDLDFIDIVCEHDNLERLAPYKDENIPFNGVTDKHIRLSRRHNISSTRILISTHLRQSYYTSFIKDVYEEVTSYLNRILYECALKNLDPNRFIGDISLNIPATDILHCSSMEDVIKHITNIIYRKLENQKNTKKLIINISNRLGLDVNETDVSNAIELLNIRHIFVHRDGIPDKEFLEKNPNIPLRKNNRIKLSYPLLMKIKDAAFRIVDSIDREIILKKLIPEEYIHLSQNKTQL